MSEVPTLYEWAGGRPAIERMIEDHLTWANAHARWLIPSNFDKGPAIFFGGCFRDLAN